MEIKRKHIKKILTEILETKKLVGFLAFDVYERKLNATSEQDAGFVALSQSVYEHFNALENKLNQYLLNNKKENKGNKKLPSILKKMLSNRRV